MKGPRRNFFFFLRELQELWRQRAVIFHLSTLALHEAEFELRTLVWSQSHVH